MTNQQKKIIFTFQQIDIVFDALISIDPKLKISFSDYLANVYKGDNSKRLSYIDIGEIARYINNNLKVGQTQFFQTFFETVEHILKNCDSYIEDLIVVGLFESIQNISGSEINYQSGFDNWLQPLSKLKWDNLIDSWEGNEWRTSK